MSTGEQMKRRKLFTILVAALLTTTAAFAQDKVKTIDNLLKTYQEYGQLNGTVLVAENGKVIYEKGFGLADMEWINPNGPNTKFRIGSVTKQFTATLILQLVEEGKIKLDGKLSDYLPDYRKDTGSKVTIHHLLNHTSGIPSYTNQPNFGAEISRNPYTVKDFVKKHTSGDLEFEPGSKFSYNNSGYFLLGAIVEQVTGKTYADVLKERIFGPVGMNDSGYDTHAPIIARRARGYEKTLEGFANADYLDMGVPYSAGSLYSTVNDMYKWDQSLYKDKVLSAESKKLMFTPGLSNYGYGFGIVDREIGKTGKKTKVIGHNGGIKGFNSSFTRFVDQGNLVVILDNVGLGRYHGAITNSILNILNDQPVDAPKRSIAETLNKTLKEKGAAAAAAEYRTLKGANSVIYDFSEGELNMLGYHLSKKNKPKDAIEIFKLNVEAFPRSSNTYDSLGEAYLKDGNKEMALVNYKKAVEQDPNNASAVRAINQIEGKEVRSETTVLESYVGDYELRPTLILSVTTDGARLFGQATGQSKMELEPVSAAQFTVTAIGASITFTKNADGKITGLTLLQGGRMIEAKKIK